MFRFIRRFHRRHLRRRRPQNPILLNAEERHLDIGDRFAIIASVHGAYHHLKHVVKILANEGITEIFIAGDLTGECGGSLTSLLFARQAGLHVVLGNHDLMVFSQDDYHMYRDDLMAIAERLNDDIDHQPGLRNYLNNLPVIIRTPFFSVVHETVREPYYARQGKRKKKYYTWSHGAQPDENSYDICYNRISHPYFIGSDHIAYVMKKDKQIGVSQVNVVGGDECELQGAAVVSVPSLVFPRDEKFSSGYVVGQVGPSGELNLRFINLIVPREILEKDVALTRKYRCPEEFVNVLYNDYDRHAASAPADTTSNE